MRRMILGLMVTAMLLGLAPAAYAPATFTVSHNQAQFQWRAWAPFTGWSMYYQEYATSTEYTLTGNVLHMAFSYSPPVYDELGTSSAYVFDKASGRWIQHEGTIEYRILPYYYGVNLQIVNHFRGYVSFSGPPDENNFVHGVAYQWCYIYVPYDYTSPEWDAARGPGGKLQYAQWDDVMQAWLIGFSIYLWDATVPSTPYVISFQVPKPVPASNYNPFGL